MYYESTSFAEDWSPQLVSSSLNIATWNVRYQCRRKRFPTNKSSNSPKPAWVLWLSKLTDSWVSIQCQNLLTYSERKWSCPISDLSTAIFERLLQDPYTCGSGFWPHSHQPVFPGELSSNHRYVAAVSTLAALFFPLWPSYRPDRMMRFIILFNTPSFWFRDSNSASFG